LVTVVFQNLSTPDDKRFFRQIMLDILDTPAEGNLYYSIVAIDNRLQILQPFTQDREALRQVMNKSLMWSFVQYQNQNAEVKQGLRRILERSEQSGNWLPGSKASNDSAGLQMARIQLEMINYQEALDRESDAQAAIYSLMQLVRAQAVLPGRKAVLYLNPWFKVTHRRGSKAPLSRACEQGVLGIP
jgi:hypothetical protein